MQTVAVAWQMYDLTRNPLDLGLVGLTQFVPAALFVLVAGHIADRYDRRRIISICQLVAGLAGATLALGTAGGWMTRESLLAVVFVTGSARAFEQTTLSTLLPGIVPMSLLARATAAGASATQVAVIAGPAVGGLLYAVSPILVYALCATLYVTSSILISTVTADRTARSREPLSLAMLFAGFFYIRHNPIVLGVITLDLFAVVLGGVFALLPVFARDVFGTDAWGLGLLRASPGIGALITAGLMAYQPLRQHIGRIMFGGGRNLRHRDHRLRAVALVHPVDDPARHPRLCRHAERRHPHDADPARDARRHARPGQRGEFAVRHHLQPAR